MKRKRICSLIICMSLFLTGCGADTDEESSTVDPVSRYMDSRQAEDSASGGSGGSPDSSVTDADGTSQPNIMENPAYNALGRQVVTAVVTAPFRETMDRIIAFNEDSPDYFIEMKSYGGGANAFENLETQLPLEVLSGKGPDMVVWDNSLNYSPALVSGRLMEDLYGLMDADPDFHREDYYGNILQAFEEDGGLYLCPASFSVETGCIKADEMEAGRGATESWTLSEMIETYENSARADRFSLNFSETLQLKIFCMDCMENFIDWGSGECRFDTPEFVELLEWCDTFPEQLTEPEGYNSLEEQQSGRVFWQPVRLMAPWDVAFRETMNSGTDILWPGHPVSDGEQELGGGIAEPYGECYSICRNSGNKEAAWEVIKSFLMADAQREVRGIPLLRSVSEERIQDALTVEYETVDGVRQEKVKYDTMAVTTGESAETFEFSCITEQDAETYRSIIENTHRSYGSDPGILDIIMEEAGAFFGGDKDAATVADIIQNRVSIYVGERMK
ncbi:MAG: hypothetical protein NC121_07400 [Blautia sp.]|nr:hypothetical protein [Blautia sp.]